MSGLAYERDAGRVQPERSYFFGSFDTVGLGAVGILCAIANVTAGLVVVVHSVKVITNAGAAAIFGLERHVGGITVPGTAIVPTPFRSDIAAALAVCSLATAADGGAATAITVGGAAGPWAARARSRDEAYQEMLQARSLVLLTGDVLTCRWTQGVLGTSVISVEFSEY